jgi:hypothetical protein
MENEILKRQHLLMKYDLNSTLTENLDNIDEVLLEQGVVRDVVMGGGIAARELEGVLKTMMKDTKVANELKNVSLTDAKGLKTGVRTAEELASAIKLNKLSRSLRGELELAILKSRTTNKTLVDAAASNLVRNKQFISKYSAELAQGQMAYEKALKSAGYSEEAITSIVKQTENVGGKIKSGEDILKTGKDSKIKPSIKGEETLTGAKEEALAKESWMKKQKDRLANFYNNGKGKVDRALKNKWIEKGFLKTSGKISKRKLLAWAAAIGVGYYVLKSWLGTQGIEEETLTSQEKLERAKKCGHKSWDAYKASDWKCGKTGGGGSGGGGGTGGGNQTIIKSCQGTYSRGCKSDLIKKVQGCLNEKLYSADTKNQLVQDGIMGKKTETALKNYLGKKTFNDTDIDFLCKKGSETVTPTPVPTTQTPIEKLQTLKPSTIDYSGPKELQVTPKFSDRPIMGAETLDKACGDETTNKDFRQCSRRFRRVSRISTTDTGYEMNESKDSLKNLIHESLSKKIRTNKIINENFTNFEVILTESNKNIIEDFVNEVAYLKNKGISDRIINEGLGDMLSGLFGNAGTGITEYFKVKFAEWVLTKLNIADPNSFLGNVISNIFAELPIKDYGKFVSNCDFATEVISHGLADGIAQHFAKQKGYDNALSGVLLQSVSESLFSTQFMENLQDGLSNVICPLFGQIAGKVKQVASK